MSNLSDVLRHLYDRFNARDIDAVLALLAENVAWANGMDGGHVHGRDAVRQYWTHQWSLVSPHVDPLKIEEKGDGTVLVLVKQSVRDLDGHALLDQIHGLKDKTVQHVFHFDDGAVTRFDIADVP